MKIHQTDFSKGNVNRNILEMAVPMTMAQILNLLYNIVDRIYIGRIPEAGTTALTGVGICFPIITLITAFTYLFGKWRKPSVLHGTGQRKSQRSRTSYGKYLFHASSYGRASDGCWIYFL